MPRSAKGLKASKFEYRVAKMEVGRQDKMKVLNRGLELSGNMELEVEVVIRSGTILAVRERNRVCSFFAPKFGERGHMEVKVAGSQP
jgi:hypothetical protein